MKKIYLACVAGVLVVAGGAVAFLMNGDNSAGTDTGYEAAERGFISQFVNLTQPNNQLSFTLGYTHNLTGLGGMLGFDLPQFELAMDTTAVGTDSLTNLSLVLETTTLNLQLAQLGEQLFTAFPDISAYFLETLLVDETNPWGELQEQLLAFTTLAPQVVDLYFEQVYPVTERTEAVTISGGGLANISMVADRYQMLFDVAWVRDFLVSIQQLTSQDHPDLSEWVSDALTTFGQWTADHSPTQPLAEMTAWVVDGQMVARDVDVFTPEHVLSLSYQNLHNGSQRWFNLQATMAAPHEGHIVEFSGLFNHMGQGYQGPLAFSLSHYAHDHQAPLMELTLALENIRRNANGHVLGNIHHSNTLQGINFSLTGELVESHGHQGIDISGQAGMFGFNMDLGNLALSWHTDHVSQLAWPAFDASHRVLITDGIIDPAYAERGRQLQADLEAVILSLPEGITALVASLLTPTLSGHGGLEPWAH